MRISLDNAVSFDDMNQINPSTNSMSFYTNEWDIKNPGVPMPTNPPDNSYSKNKMYGLNGLNGLNGENNGNAPSAMMRTSHLDYTNYNMDTQPEQINKPSMNDYLSNVNRQSPENKQNNVRFAQDVGQQIKLGAKNMPQQKPVIKKVVIKEDEVEDDDDNEETEENGHVFLLGSLFLLIAIFFLARKYNFKI
jgi:hypothetical protein